MSNIDIGIALGILLGIIALCLTFWSIKHHKMNDDLHDIELNHVHRGMNALMDDFNNYQIETDRKIAELKKQLEVERNTRTRQLASLRKELPSIIGKVVGQIEFAQDKMNRQM